jgi:hypothetical protein
VEVQISALRALNVIRRRSAIPELPATNGTVARKNPVKRPKKAALPPWRSKKPSRRDRPHGDGAAAIGALATRLREREDGQSTITVVRAWLDQLAGWFEPELVLQQRLAREVPLVGARRLQLYGEAERAIADALAEELGGEQQLAARLAAAALVAGLRVAEETAADRMEREERALTDQEIALLLDGAVDFAEAGIAAIGDSGSAAAPERRH